MTYERRSEQLARVAGRHPDAYARACAAAVLLARERQAVSSAAILVVAGVDQETAERVAERAAAEPGRSQVGGRAYRGIAELEPAAFGLG